MNTNNKKYMNPYLAGFLLGLLILAAFYFTGEGLGASGAYKRMEIAVIETVAPSAIEGHSFFGKYMDSGQNSLENRLVYMIIGVFAGGFISGAISGRLGFKIEHSPKITSKTRLIAAVIGGIFFGFGSQLGRGCTSGSGLSGMASLSLAGFIALFAIFGGGYLFAYFFRKLWI